MIYSHSAITVDNKGLVVAFSMPRKDVDALVAEFKGLFLPETDDNPKSILPLPSISHLDQAGGKLTDIEITVSQRNGAYVKNLSKKFVCDQGSSLDITFEASSLWKLFFSLGENYNSIKGTGFMMNDINLFLKPICRNGWKFFISDDFAKIRITCGKNSELRVLGYFRSYCENNKLKFINYS
jgi:hypothetical protein